MFPETDDSVRGAIDLAQVHAARRSLDEVIARHKPTAAVDFSKKEAAGYSIQRAIRAAMTRDWSGAGLEREASSTLEKVRGLTPQSDSSFFVPTHIPFQVPGAQRSTLLRGLMAQRAIYQVGTAGQGGNLVETELLAADFIEVLRNATVVGQLGARYLTGLVGEVNIPRQDAQTPTYWVGESVALTEGEATFDQVQLRPHTASW